MPKPLAPAKAQIASSFAAAAHTYEQAAFIEQEIGTRLLERLNCLNLQPQTILDLGCATGFFTPHLHALFPQATIISLDIALAMLNFANHELGKTHCICADAEQLPFAAQQFDLIFANCLLNSSFNLPTFFTEINRVLQNNGLFLFSSFGPDTLQELGLTDIWIDMHHLGDLLLQQKFKNPVVDTEYLHCNYSSLQQLVMDLQQTGSYAVDASQLENLSAPIKVTFEVIYGHALGTSKISNSCDKNKIPITII